MTEAVRSAGTKHLTHTKISLFTSSDVLLTEGLVFGGELDVLATNRHLAFY